MMVTYCLFLFTTELIVSAIFDSNSNTHRLIKFFEICNLRKFNSLKFNFCLSCKIFCFKNNPLYSITTRSRTKLGFREIKILTITIKRQTIKFNYHKVFMPYSICITLTKPKNFIKIKGELKALTVTYPHFP